MRDLLDVIAEMIREGYIEAKYSNDEEIAPLLTIDFSALHHYWFGATQRGIEAWNAYRKATKD